MRLKFTQCVLGFFVILASVATNSMAGELLHGPVKGPANVTSNKVSIIIYRENGGDTKNVPAVFLNGSVVVASLLPGEYAQTRICSSNTKLRIATRGSIVSKGRSTKINISKDSIVYVKVAQTQNKTFAPYIVDAVQAQKELENIKSTSNVLNRHTPQIVLGTDSLFAFNSAELLSSSRKTMNKLAHDINMCPGQVNEIKITGHTDRIGSDAYNNTLSLKRAQAVADYLAKNGITMPMKVEGHGSREPVTTHCRGKHSPQLIQCLQPDRRVVVEY